MPTITFEHDVGQTVWIVSSDLRVLKGTVTSFAASRSQYTIMSTNPPGQVTSPFQPGTTTLAPTTTVAPVVTSLAPPTTTTPIVTTTATPVPTTTVPPVTTTTTVAPVIVPPPAPEVIVETRTTLTYTVAGQVAAIRTDGTRVNAPFSVTVMDSDVFSSADEAFEEAQSRSA